MLARRTSAVYFISLFVLCSAHMCVHVYIRAYVMFCVCTVLLQGGKILLHIVQALRRMQMRFLDVHHVVGFVLAAEQGHSAAFDVVARLDGAVWVGAHLALDAHHSV